MLLAQQGIPRREVVVEYLLAVSTAKVKYTLMSNN